MGKDFPISQCVLGAIAILQSMEGSMSTHMIFAWAIGGATLISEVIWRMSSWDKWRLTSDRPNLYRILSCLLVVLATAYLTYSQFVRANIEFKVGNDQSYIQDDKLSATPTRWLRVFVYNRGWREAQCRVFLNNLTKDGVKQPIVFNEYHELQPDPAQQLNESASGIAIPAGDGRYFNLAYVEINASVMHVTRRIDIQNGGPLDPGTYTLEISSNSPGCTSNKSTFVVTYLGGKNILIK
jgi:hypothetical protein